ncbi:MAG: helicase-exonuclease AddAB subunit AddA [Clostridia bacterium]
MRNWTDAQADAISARRGTVLVSAAAGSGKTAVLVERLIQRITDTDNPIDADKMLVVTFTNSAAAEMKERAEKAVLSLLKQYPQDKHLQRQQMLIHQMNVSTVHGFCSKLCKEYFHVLDIAPDFKIIPDKQNEDLIETAISKVILDKLNENDYVLSDAFSSERNDERLYSTIKSLYNFANTHISPNDWLDEKLEMYNISGYIEESEWGKTLIEHAKQLVELCLNLTNDSLNNMTEDEKIFTAYNPAFTQDLVVLEELMNTLQIKRWDEICEAFGDVKWKKLGTLKGYNDDPLKIKLTSSRKNVKAKIETLTEYFCDNEKQCLEDIQNSYQVAKNLIETVKSFGDEFAKLKKDKKFLDYNDLEHKTLELLLSRNEKTIVPSEIALQISDRFEEIMIDEYQDTNQVQDWIFRAISKNDNNKFMVGDLKQCVYSFRQAMPEIFISYKERFLKYDKNKDEYPAKVILDKNFRSRDTVITSINNVFTRLMSKSCGGVDYNEEEALSQGAIYPENVGCETQIDFLQKGDLPTEIAEARHIASTINEIMQSDFLVTDGDKQRKATYSDFCILLRNTKNTASIYAKELEENGIPAWSQSTQGFFSKKEIMYILSFLEVIDNPNQDIPLLSLLMGPIYGFNPDEIAKLRIENKNVSLYVALRKSDKFKTFIADIEKYRLISLHMPTDLFLNKLYIDTSYEDIVLAMDNGQERVANLRQIRQYATEFESSGYVGIAGFIRFINNLKRNNSDLEAANLVSEKADVVKIMSIHKSKGLEFPVCIVAGLGKKGRTITDDVVLNSNLGLGMKLRDKQSSYKYSNVIREAIALQNKMEKMSEELRVLYVAMTRAKEKLVMISTIRGVEKTATNLNALLTKGERIKPYSVKSLSTMAQWLMLCCLKHPNGNYLRDLASATDDIISYDNFTPWNIRVITTFASEEKLCKIEETPQVADMDLVEELKKKVEFKYEKAYLNKIPAKVTASSIAHKQDEIHQTLSTPAFLAKKGLTAAQKGTALHNFIEYCNFENAIINPSLEAQRLVKDAFITKEQADVIDFGRVKAFLNSPLGTRILNSNEVDREFRFFADIPASLVDKEFPGDVKVSLQGAVDCCFVENGKLYIVDFKTDRIKETKDFIKEYGIQLQLYANALKQVKNMEIGACFIYSFYLDKQIELDNML